MENVISFLRELNLMLRQKLPLPKSILAISHDFQSLLGTSLEEIAKDVERGVPFAEAIHYYPQYFDSSSVRLIKAGEEAGRMEEALMMVAESIGIRKRWHWFGTRIMVYPLLLLLFAFSICSMIFIFILPKFAAIYSGYGAQLPVATRSIVKMSDLVVQWLFPVVFIVMVVATGLFLLSRLQVFRGLLDPVTRTVFSFRSAWRLRVSSTFCGALSFALEGGVPWLEALESAARSTGSHSFLRAVQRTMGDFESGEPLSKVLNNRRLLPESFVWRIHLAERSEELPEILRDIYVDGIEEYQSFVERRMQIIEPLANIAIGIGIGFVVIGMYMPIFGLISVH